VTEQRPFTASSFREYLGEKRLMAVRCLECGKLFLPPRPFCIACRNETVEWATLGGSGRLVAFTTIAVGPGFMIRQGYDRKNHYCSGIVELEEGVRINALITGIDTSKPEQLKIGTALHVEFLGSDGNHRSGSLVVFRPREHCP